VQHLPLYGVVRRYGHTYIDMEIVVVQVVLAYKINQNRFRK